MASASDSRLLKDIASVRALQTLGCERDVGACAARHRQSSDIVDGEVDQLNQLEQGWHAVLEGPTFAPESSRAWSDAMMRQVGNLDIAQQDLANAEADLRDNRSAWRAAMTRQTDAERHFEEARRRELAERDEIALHEATERHLARWWRERR